MNSAQYAAFVGLEPLPELKPTVAGRSIIPGLAALVPLLMLAAAASPPVEAVLLGPVHTFAHSLVEILYIAGAVAIFSVTWYAPRGEFRLRPTLVACLCLPSMLIGILHLLVEPGMPVFIPVSNAEDTASYFGAIARFTLPLVLLGLTRMPRDAGLSASLRWSLLFAALAGIVPLTWMGLSDPFGALDDFAARPHPGLHAAIVALYLPTIFMTASRRQDLDRPEARHIMLAAALGALAEACLGWSVPDQPGIASLTGHIYNVLAMAAAFAASYGQAIDVPHRAMERSHIAALLDKERLEAVFRAITDGIVVVDRNLEIVAMNPVARHIAGCSGEIVIGLPLSQALASLAPDIRSRLVADVEACLHDGCPQRGIEASVWPIGNGFMAIQRSVSPIRDADGQVRGAVLGLSDVSERWRLDHELHESAGYARRLIEASIDPMIVIGEDGTVTDANTAAESIAGLPRDALLRSDFVNLFTEPERAREALDDVFSSGPVRDMGLTVASAGGGRIEVSCNITPFSDAGGGIRGAFVVARDVTDLRQAQLQLEFQASCDALTALPNRLLFRERVEHAMALGRRTRRLSAVMLLDLDDFKDINDTRGHAIGDELLKTLASRLSECLRETDTVARLGGDEFAILLEDIGCAADVQTLATKLIEAVAEPVVLEGAEVVVTCSIGITIHPLDAADADTLMRNADTALYRAKGAGKGCYHYYTADMNAAVQRRTELARRLRGALGRGELSLHYQPQLHLGSGSVVGVEALLRWDAEGLGPVSPAEFVPIAEDTGLILPIGTWVLQEACRQAAQWRDIDGLEIAVAVNLSARQFRDAALAATVERALAETGLPAHLLELEITESVLMRDAGRAADALARLKERGIRVSIDDFGTGYSSLAYLKTFPLDRLKIDRSFVIDIPGDANDEAIVRSVIALAHSLGLKVVAEGVETVEQMAFLHELGCDEIQGYYVSRPRTAAQLLEFLRQETRRTPTPPEAANDTGVLARWFSMPA